jgi:hypothetical protein
MLLLGCGALLRCLRSSASFCSWSDDIMSCSNSGSSGGSGGSAYYLFAMAHVANR